MYVIMFVCMDVGWLFVCVCLIVCLLACLFVCLSVCLVCSVKICLLLACYVLLFSAVFAFFDCCFFVVHMHHNPMLKWLRTYVKTAKLQTTNMFIYIYILYLYLYSL